MDPIGEMLLFCRKIFPFRVRGLLTKLSTYLLTIKLKDKFLVMIEGWIFLGSRTRRLKSQIYISRNPGIFLDFRKYHFFSISVFKCIKTKISSRTLLLSVIESENRNKSKVHIFNLFRGNWISALGKRLLSPLEPRKKSFEEWYANLIM